MLNLQCRLVQRLSTAGAMAPVVGTKSRSTTVFATMSAVGIASYVASTQQHEKERRATRCDDAALACAALAGAAAGFGAAWIYLARADPTKLLSKAYREALPDRIILVRHGQSEANADYTLWREKADNLIALSDKGQEQAVAAGERIKKIVGDETVGFIVSPFTRTMQTMRGIRKAFQEFDQKQEGDPVGRNSGAKSGWVYIDPNIREQEMGSNLNNLQGDEAAECRRIQREVIGRFYYRFPSGESGADVFGRVSQWWHNVAMPINSQHGNSPVQNVVVVTHGLTMRFILMVVQGWSVNTFETVWNADNCAVWVLKKDLSKSGESPYELDFSEGDALKSTRSIGVTFANGQLPQSFVLNDYLSIPAPRTRQFSTVTRMLAEQHGLVPENIQHLDFYAKTDGSLSHYGKAGHMPSTRPKPETK